MKKQWMLLILLACVSLLAGCGSAGQANPMSNATAATGSSTSVGDNSGTPSTTPTSSTGNFSVSPSKVRVLLGSTQQFTASVPVITWEAWSTVTDSHAGLGSISNAGLYTAPAIVPTGQMVGIVAASGATGPSGTGNAWVAVGATSSRFAYVSSATDDSIQIFTADGKTGQLTATSTFSVGSGSGPTSLALAPNGKFLFSLNRGSNDISIYVIDPATGYLSDAGKTPTPTGPYAMVFSPDGNYAYVSCDGASTIAAYAFSLSSGALTPLGGGSYTVGGGRVQGLAISPDGKSLYALNPDANQIVALSINPGDGSLSAMAGSPIAAHTGLSSIVATDVNVYLGSDSGAESYMRASTSGAALTYLWATPAPKSLQLLQNMSDGVVIAVSPTSGAAYTFEPDGIGQYGLTYPFPAVATGISPIAGAWLFNDTGDNWVYVLNRQTDASSTTGSIGAYKVNFTNGLSGPITTIPTSLHNPTGFVITP